MRYKKAVVFGVLLAVCFLSSGCETARGFCRDAKSSWRVLKNADKWFKENYW